MSLSDKARRGLENATGSKDAGKEIADAVNAGQAASETIGALSDVGTGTPTSGNILIGDGTKFETRALSGDATLASSGAMTVAATVAKGTPTAGNIPVGNSGGTAWASVALSGDATLASTGALAVAATIAKGTPTAGRFFVGNGTVWVPVAMSGEATMASTGAVTLNASVKQQTVLIPIADLAAGDDITDLPIFARDGGCTLVKVSLVAQGAFAGVDAGNTMVVTLKDGAANTIVTKTYNDAVVPADNDLNNLGTLDVTHKVLGDEELVTLTITNGATADPPAMVLKLEFTPTVAVAPIVTGAEIDATGLTLTITFSMNATGHTGFTLNSDGGAVVPTYSSGDGGTSQVFDLDRTVLATETLTLDYAPGNVVSDFSIPLAAFTGGAVTNSSTEDVPTASFTQDVTSGSAPLTVTFTDTSTETPTSWAWEKNDGGGWAAFDGTPTAQNPVEDFAAGTWSVRLTATNANGPSAPTTMTDLITAS